MAAAGAHRLHQLELLQIKKRKMKPTEQYTYAMKCFEMKLHRQFDRHSYELAVLLFLGVNLLEIKPVG